MSNIRIGLQIILFSRHRLYADNSPDNGFKCKYSIKRKREINFSLCCCN